MISISESQLKQIEYLIAQSIRGNHVLFDTEVLRKSLSETPKGPEPEVNTEVERLLALPSIAEKRAFLDHLDRKTLKRVIQTYFHIVSNSLFENTEVRH